jgi:hypothetical protein
MAESMPTRSPQLSWDERLHYRDRLRNARYAALADAEGFGEVCFAIEALGLRLRGTESTMGNYVEQIRPLSGDAPTLTELATQFPSLFTRFDALYETVKNARNDAMHTGVYARHATTAAIELCIGLEEAIMKGRGHLRSSIADFMVKAPVSVERWQPVAHARQLMLTHSFSFLPVLLNKWMLVPEIAMAQFLHGSPDRRKSLATSIEAAAEQGLNLVVATTVKASDEIAKVLEKKHSKSSPTLWLVTDRSNRLCGVLSPFELM